MTCCSRPRPQTLVTIAADPRHLGARIPALPPGAAQLGSALTHHPHIHMIVPGGGIIARRRALGGSCRPGFFLPVRVLSRLFRRLFLEKLMAAHKCRPSESSRQSRSARHARALRGYLAPLRKTRNGWSTPRGRSAARTVLAYLSRYTHASPSPTAD